jgi:hypothetical protein
VLLLRLLLRLLQDYSLLLLNYLPQKLLSVRPSLMLWLL